MVSLSSRRATRYSLALLSSVLIVAAVAQNVQQKQQFMNSLAELNPVSICICSLERKSKTTKRKKVMNVTVFEDPCPIYGQSVQDLIDSMQNDEDYESDNE